MVSGAENRAKRFPGNRAARRDQHDAVGERGKHGGLAETKRAPLCRRTAGQPCRAAGQQQAQHVGKIVSSVRNQRRGIGPEPGQPLDQHEACVQPDRNGITSAAASMIVRVVIVAMMVVVMGRHAWALFERLRRDDQLAPTPRGARQKQNGPPKAGRSQRFLAACSYFATASRIIED